MHFVNYHLPHFEVNTLEECLEPDHSDSDLVNLCFPHFEVNTLKECLEPDHSDSDTKSTNIS